MTALLESSVFRFGVLIGFFSLFQLVLTIWSFLKTRSYLLAVATLLVPFLGVPLSLYRLRETAKDNQVAGMVTYLCVILGIVFFLWKLPPDEVPWMAIFGMEFFAGLAVLNTIDVSVAMRIRENE